MRSGCYILEWSQAECEFAKFANIIQELTQSYSLTRIATNLMFFSSVAVAQLSSK